MTVAAPSLLFESVDSTLRLRRFQIRSACAKSKIVAVRYCLGGCGVVVLARAGVPVRGVLSLHGVLSAPIPTEQNAIRAKILVLHW
jgi:dienelactone hydrolase